MYVYYIYVLYTSTYTSHAYRHRILDFFLGEENYFFNLHLHKFVPLQYKFFSQPRRLSSAMHDTTYKVGY